MFLLRCLFWLSVMVSCLPVGREIVDGWQGAKEPAAAQIADAALSRAGAWCAARAVQCARDAGRLTTLVATTTALDPILAEKQDGIGIGAHARHRAAKIVLTTER